MPKHFFFPLRLIDVLNLFFFVLFCLLSSTVYPCAWQRWVEWTQTGLDLLVVRNIDIFCHKLSIFIAKMVNGFNEQVVSEQINCHVCQLRQYLILLAHGKVEDFICDCSVPKWTQVVSKIVERFLFGPWMLIFAMVSNNSCSRPKSIPIWRPEQMYAIPAAILI